MYEDTLSFSLFGARIFAYGLYIATGALWTLLILGLLSKAKAFPKGTAPLFGVLGLPLGLLCGRLLFCLMDNRFYSMFTLRAALSFWGGGFSMVGVLLGAALAAFLTARLQRISVLSLLDALVPSLLLFLFFARLGEGCTELLGRSRPLVNETLQNSFLAMSDGYDAYLKTYLLEAATALILLPFFMPLSLRLPRGETLRLGMLLLGCTQTLWESLRFDAHMRFSFISMQQILYACMFAYPLLYYAVRYARHRRARWPLPITILSLAALTGAVVWLEFLIDRSGMNRLALYAIYALLLSLPVVFTLIFRKRSDASHDQRKGRAHQ